MKIVLCMIVKDESHVIQRCLRSVKPLISSWVICDTGSTDDTKKIIQNVMGEIPGELFDDKWVDFAHNRTLAIQRANARNDADYILVIDADHVWHGAMPPLTADGYLVEHRYNELVYGIPCIMKTGREWHYECPVHEVISTKDAGPFAMLPSPPYVMVYPEGARSRSPTKYADDAALLLQHVAQNPEDARATYYLAQSYKDAGNLVEARKWYKRRSEMDNGWWEEKWHALYRMAQCAQNLNLDFAIVMTEYLSAYQANFSRAEPLLCLASYARAKNFLGVTAMAARQALTIPQPESNHLFVEAPAYDWPVELEFSIAAYYTGDREGGLASCQKLLQNPRVPAHVRERVESNIKFYKGELPLKVA